MLFGLSLAIGVMALAPFVTAQQNRIFVPENAVRGYLDFEFAPPHNEPDLGMCAAGSTRCGAFARFVWGGYVEFQPFGGAYARRLFLFIDPKMYGGDNLPGVRYTASAAPILWEREAGFGIELPRHFELRATHHDVQAFGKYSGPNKVIDLNANGPLGLYTTVGVRWYFGKYGRDDLHR